MTNFEYYAEQIQTVNYDFAVSKDGEIMWCSTFKCDKCKFNTKGKCRSNKIKWLYEEHIEQPKITEEEYNFILKFLDCKYYIARNKLGALRVYAEKPHKEDYQWHSTDEQLYIQPIRFPFIKWEDEEPWYVEDLLKLEVIDNE